MSIRVDFMGNRSFKAKVGTHEIVTDLPLEKGGEDKGPTPSEAFIASIGCCIGLYVAGYMRTAKLDPEGLSIELDWKLDDKKTRIGKIDISLRTPHAELGSRKKAIIAAAEKCTIHGTLHDEPDIKITAVEDATGALSDDWNGDEKCIK